MNLHQSALEFIEDTIEPVDFINAASTSANHRISNGVLLSKGVIGRLEDFIAHQNGEKVTSEKNTARSIATAMNYYYADNSRPISDDPDKDYAIHRQSCTVVTTSQSSRRDTSVRSTCPEVTIVETVVCAIPYLRPDDNDNILPHPYLDRAYIDVYGDDFTMHGLVIN